MYIVTSKTFSPHSFTSLQLQILFTFHPSTSLFRHLSKYMKFDYHIYTESSYDSSLKAEQLINKAISLDYDEIAITEHLDLLPQELSVFGLPSLTQYTARIATLQAQYPQLRILCGIELGDYHQVRSFAFNLIKELGFQIILGSVHFLSDHINVAIPLAKPLSKAQVQDYYLQNLNLVSTCDIHVLAHLGVYKRYYPAIPDEKSVLPIIKDIFNAMIQRSIALEINYSPLRKKYPTVIPEPSFIELYRSLGGSLFSIGSDAHTLSQFNDYYNCLPPDLPSFRYPGAEIGF